MNILNILNYSPEFGGGVLNHLSALGKLCLEKGDKLYIAFPKEREWQKELFPICEVIIIPEILNPLWSGFRRKIRKICIHHSIDILHIHFTFAQVFSLACANKKWNIPTIYHWHNPPTPLSEFLTPINTIRGKIKRLVSGLIARFTDKRIISHHISISREISELLIVNRWSSKHKITVLPNGISPSKHNNVMHQKKSNIIPVIGTVANFRPQKDHITLLNAFYILDKAEVQCELWLIGDGPTRPDVEKLGKKLGIESKIRFIGTVSNPDEFYRQFDIFVLSTHYEGQGLVLLEAMGFGLPIIATRISGIPEVITNGVNGFLVNPRDPDDLARALKLILSDKSLFEKLSKAATGSLKNQITVDEWACHVISIYNDVLSTIES